MKRTTRKKRKQEIAWIASVQGLPIIRKTRAGIRFDIDTYRVIGCDDIRGPVKVVLP